MTKSITFDSKDLGSLIADFEKLGSFILDKGKIAGGSQSFFRMQDLFNLNSLLTKPIEVDLKRPNQKSFPSLHALNALLRLSGIVRVIQTKKDTIFSIDQETYDSWMSLNSIEKYCQLLFIPFSGDFDEALGERGGLSFCFLTLTRLFRQREQIWHFSSYQDQQNFAYSITHHLALFELLGWISITSSKPESGKGWRFNSLQFTSFGKEIVNLIIQLIDPIWRSAEFPSFITLREELKPLLSLYFPEWKRDLIVHEWPPNQGVHVFKVSVAGAWRRIAISSEDNLDTFSDIILKAFNFDSDHLYYFAYQDQRGITRKIYHDYMTDEPLLASEWTIESLRLSVDQFMTFLFDFGDEWKFDVQLEQLNPENMKVKQPTVLEKGGKRAPKQYFYEEDE